MAITAEQLNVILSAKDKQFAKAMNDNARRVERFAKRSQKSLNKSSRSFNKLATMAKRIAPAIGAAMIVAQVKKVTASLDEIGKTASNLGLTTDALQEMRVIAESSGLTFDEFTKGFSKFSVSVGEAATGVGEALGAFKSLGIELKDANGNTRDAEVLFNELSDALKGVTNDSDRASIAADLFGQKVGVKMLNLLKNGSRGMATMRREARELGIVIDSDLIANAEATQNKLDLMSRVISAQLSTALVELAPLLVAGAEGLAKLVTNIVAGIKAVQHFLNPVGELQVQTDNVVAAMSDEIRQSQRLNATLNNNAFMTLKAAQANLKDAIARHENAKAMIAQQRAAALSSQEYKSLNEQIQNTLSHMHKISASGREGSMTTSQFKVYSELEDLLMKLMNRQSELLLTDAKLASQFDLTTENVNKLTKGIKDAKDGLVDLTGMYIDPIKASERFSFAQKHNVKNLDELLAALDKTGLTLTDLGLTTQSATDFLEEYFKVMKNLPPVVTEFEKSLNNLGLSVDEFQSISQTLEGSMTDAFMSMVDGTATVQDAFRTMARDIIKQLYQVLFVQRMVGSVQTGTGIAGAIGSAFGIKPIPQEAAGGTVSAGTPHIVGEHGRELFVPQQAGRIMTTAQTQAMTNGGGGSVVVNQNINVSTGVAQTVRTEIKSLMPQIAEGTKNAVLDAKRRGGSFGSAFA